MGTQVLFQTKKKKSTVNSESQIIRIYAEEGT